MEEEEERGPFPQGAVVRRGVAWMFDLQKNDALCSLLMNTIVRRPSMWWSL